MESVLFSGEQPLLGGLKVGYVTVATLMEAVDAGEYRRADMAANLMLRKLAQKKYLKPTKSGRIWLSKAGKQELARLQASKKVVGS